MRKSLSKIQSQSRLSETVQLLKSSGQKVVFTNGCFDLIHPGHIRYLVKAREEGDVLVVAVNSDRSVQELKGPGRPIVPEEERAEVLAALECVDYVTVFDEKTPLRIITSLVPDVLVKGGDWPVGQIVGRDVVEGAGGRVVSIDFVEGYSTSEILRRISSRN